MARTERADVVIARTSVNQPAASFRAGLGNCSMMLTRHICGSITVEHAGRVSLRSFSRPVAGAVNVAAAPDYLDGALIAAEEPAAQHAVGGEADIKKAPEKGAFVCRGR